MLKESLTQIICYYVNKIYIFLRYFWFLVACRYAASCVSTGHQELL